MHATLKSRFRLRTPYTKTELILSLEEFYAQAVPARSGKLIPKIIGGFLALASMTALEGFNHLACDCVRFSEPHRAALNEEDIAKQQKFPLSQYQGRILFEWGYPYVFDAFKFHITLIGWIEGKRAAQLIQYLKTWLNPILQGPFVILDLVLTGEDEAGQFHELLRRDLKG